MKKLLFSVFVLLTFLCAKCEDETPKNPIDLLPPATQTGANTFGCLVDGEAFTPDGRPNSFKQEYSYMDSGYYLRVTANSIVEGDLISVGCTAENVNLEEGKTYALLSRESGNISGRYFAMSDAFYTNTEETGEIFITHYDPSKKIISANFWFNVRDKKGAIRQIREGRFDIKY